MLTLTPSAIAAIEKFIKGSDTPVAGLRISISGGGCSGAGRQTSALSAGQAQTVTKNPRIERLPLLFRAPTP